MGNASAEIMTSRCHRGAALELIRANYKCPVIKTKTQLQPKSSFVIIEIDAICGEHRAWSHSEARLIQTPNRVVQSDAVVGNQITFVWLSLSEALVPLRT